jgi:hypothetical protein
MERDYEDPHNLFLTDFSEPPDRGEKNYFLKIQRNPKIPKRPAINRKRLVGSGSGSTGATAKATPGIRTRERTESSR